MTEKKDEYINFSKSSEVRDTASRKGGKIGQAVLKGVEDFVRKGIVGLPNRIKPDWLKNHYEPVKSENIRAIDALAVPTFCRVNGEQQFAEVKVIEVAEFSEKTKGEILTEAYRTHTKQTRDPYHSGICPDKTYIVLADREEKGFRMKFMQQKGHRRPQNGQGSEFWMVFNRKQGGAFIRRKIYEVFGTWLSKRCEAIKETAETKKFKLFGPIEECVKFVSALAHSLRKLAYSIKYVTKAEKDAIKRSSKLVRKAAREWGVKFNEKKGDWIYDNEWRNPELVERKIKEIATSQGIYIPSMAITEREKYVEQIFLGCSLR